MVLYIGYTDNLKRRIIQHRKGTGALFTKKYNANELIYFEIFGSKKEAMNREKQLKSWHKKWKWDLVKTKNPNLNTVEIN